MKYCAGWSISWNQDWREKYKSPQIHRWYYLCGRKWRETKEPLDEGERGKWKKKKKVKLLSRVRLFVTPWTVAYQASPSMGFSRQEYQSGSPFPSPEDLPYPGIKLSSPGLKAATLPSEPPGKPENERAGLKLNLQKTKILSSSPITSWQTDVERLEIVTDFIFLGSKITADSDCSHEIQRCLLLRRKAVTNLERILKAQILLYLQRSYSQSCVFSSSHVWLWELDIKESWAQKNWYFWTVMLEKTLERPLDCKEIQPVHPKLLNS